MSNPEIIALGVTLFVATFVGGTLFGFRCGVLAERDRWMKAWRGTDVVQRRAEDGR